MYVRSYKALPQGAPQTDTEKPDEAINNESQAQPPQEKGKKSRYKARRKMPEFHSPAQPEIQTSTADDRTPEPPNAEKTATQPIFTQGEMLVLAITALLLLEGKDDILILALGYTLCP